MIEAKKYIKLKNKQKKDRSEFLISFSTFHQHNERQSTYIFTWYIYLLIRCFFVGNVQTHYIKSISRKKKHQLNTLSSLISCGRFLSQCHVLIFAYMHCIYLCSHICGYTFLFWCIDQWFHTNISYPICRESNIWFSILWFLRGFFIFQFSVSFTYCFGFFVLIFK